ncbi:MAG: beta strand repeat-containing protein, partial [Terriglobia bacterium]
ISGGTLSATAGGVLVAENSAALNGSTSAVTLSTGSTLQVNNGQTLDVQGTIKDNGTLSLNSSGTATQLVLTGNTTLSGTGKLTLSNNAANDITATASTDVLTNSITIQGSGNIGNGMMGLVNDRTILANQSAPLLIDTSTKGFQNIGTLSVNSGDSLDIIGGTFKNLSGTTLTKGAYSVSGTLQYNSASDIATNSANITLNGASAKIIDQNSNNALVGLASNTATGKFSVGGGQILSDGASALSNAGALAVGKNSKLTLTSPTATYTQTAGATTVDGKLTAKGGITVSGGSVFGKNGTLIGNTTSSGTWNIGDKLLTAGRENISGSYTQTSAGTLNIDIGGLAAGTQFDQFLISGAASLDGTLNLDLINSFVPTLGQTFEILTASLVSGTFSTVNTPTFNGGTEEFGVVYNATNVTLDVISVPHEGLLASNSSPSDPTPEPGTLLLLGSGLLGAACFARRKTADRQRV